MINRIILVGRITKDTELRKTHNGTSTVSFTLAVNRKFKQDGQPEADFINCVAWKGTADFMANYVRKGALLGIEGRIQTRNYEDSNGKKVYITEVVCDSVQTLETRKDANHSQSQANTHASNSNATQNDYESLDISEDDIPF